VAVAVLLLSGLSAPARVHKSGSWADSQFEAAQRMQGALEQRPAVERTRHDYQRVLDAYRRVYFGSPAAAKADPSVVAVGQLLEELGRRFDDDGLLRAAIHQYEFLRRQYPGSKARFDALFRMGEIYQQDLHDQTQADMVFKEFLRLYPRNPLAEEARKALAEPVQQAGLRSGPLPGLESGIRPKDPGRKDKVAEVPDASDAHALDDDSAKDTPVEESRTEENERKNEKLARVTGIRHWSTPEYTRVAIDLDQTVKYDSQRIDHPDRVFFDLLDTKLDRQLVSKTFDVDDGFLKRIRISQFNPGRTRVVLETDEFTDFSASLVTNPPRLIIDVHNKDVHNKPVPEKVAADTSVLNAATEDEAAVVEAKAETRSGGGRTTVIGSNGLKKTIVEVDDGDDNDTAVKNGTVKDTVAKLDSPEITPPSKTPSTLATARHVESSTARSKRRPSAGDVDVREAQPTASGDRSLIRALGLKIGKIVIDPGHGGHDTGTIGPNGLEEKDLVLDVSRRLGKLLQTRLGAEVVYTRKDDTFIPLETRTSIANQEGADLFVSVHANSSHDPDARGVETYYLNFTSSPDALEVAARENAVSEESIHQLQDLVKKIALKEKIEESREFATDVESSLHSGLAAKSPGLRDRGVKKAPFIVLIGANMPSILAEISFVSNPSDERRLRTSEYRQRISESLYRGIAKYVSGLSGVKVASKIDKGEGQ